MIIKYKENLITWCMCLLYTKYIQILQNINKYLQNIFLYLNKYLYIIILIEKSYEIF